jgi:hypothetical protein
MTENRMDGGDQFNVMGKVEKLIQKNCPSPELEIISLCKTMAYCPVPAERGAFLRRVTMDVDDLSSQCRWHIGQALLLMEIHPEMLKAGEDGTNPFAHLGIPSAAQLLLRGFVAEPDRVFFDDLSENWRSGTAGGWIFHMMIDSAVYRALSALDRLAVLVWYAAGLPEERIYFRSRKMAKVDRALPSPASKALLESAERPVMELITNYRDGLSHTQKAYSRIAGSPPSDSWTTDEGKRVLAPPDWWDAADLFALANAAYTQFTDALPHVLAICQARWPGREES